nr:DNA helicase [Tanacetum cinerariifolium]
MNDRRCFETLDRTLRDLLSLPDLIFGGKTVVLGGDFRQTLPVKKGARKQEPIIAFVAESYLWWHFKICLLTINIRLLRSELNAEQQQQAEVFAKWLLDIDNDETGKPDNEDDQDSCWISIPPEYCVSSEDVGMSELIIFIYDQTILKTPTVEAFQEKAIVCPKKDTADAVNAKILSLIEGQGKTYLSKDEAMPMGKETTYNQLSSRVPYRDENLKIRSVCDDYRHVGLVNRSATEVSDTIMVRDQFLKELDSLGVRHVPSKMAEFLREIQMRDKETVAKLQILVAEKELNARKKYEFIQNSRVSCRTEDKRIMTSMPKCRASCDVVGGWDWVQMMSLYCKSFAADERNFVGRLSDNNRSVCDDYRHVGLVNRSATEVSDTIMVRDQFLKELDSLGVRHVPSKMAEFLREIQMRDKETVAKLQILVAEKELNARKKYEFIQNSRVSCRTEDVGKTVFMFCVWYAC